MSTDIERLLAAAADDSDRPLQTDIDTILTRGRRSVRSRRIAAVTTAALTTAAVIGGLTTWSSTRTDSEGPAGTEKGQTITIDVNTGRIVDNETGRTVVPAPPVSPLSDAEVLRRCQQYDRENVEFLRERKANLWDTAGPIDARWKVAVKSGDQSLLSAAFLSPDKSIVSTCTMDAPEKPSTNGRHSVTEVLPSSRNKMPDAVEAALRVPVPGAVRVLVEKTGDESPREALVGTDGFYTLGYDGTRNVRSEVKRVRAYDATGKKIWELERKPATARTMPTVDPKITIRTADPIEPVVAVTKDPQTGKPFAPAPPVSPLTDDEIRTRCKTPDGAYFKNSGGQPAGDRRTYDAGPITTDWEVVLKTGTGADFTALLVSPGRNVVAWCHVLGRGDYDYGRSGVQADGRFADSLGWAMVPDGVAQIVVDLPKYGPTRALISNGYYIWGLTGGNSDIQTVRVRGYDAQGKQVYDKRQQVDAS
ncbi:hypothetical protein [Kribbella swartbergensis]